MKIQGNNNIYTNYDKYNKKEINRKETTKNYNRDTLEIENKNMPIDKEKITIDYISKNLAKQMTQDTNKIKKQEIKSQIANSTYEIENDKVVLKIIFP